MKLTLNAHNVNILDINTNNNLRFGIFPMLVGLVNVAC